MANETLLQEAQIALKLYNEVSMNIKSHVVSLVIHFPTFGAR
jgi:hypothetical protein